MCDQRSKLVWDKDIFLNRIEACEEFLPDEEHNPVTRETPITLHELHDLSNGLLLNNISLPEDVIIHTLSFLDTKDLLRSSQVCCKWHRIVKDGPVWRIKYEREHGKKAKNLPWYVYYCFFATQYFDKNLMQTSKIIDVKPKRGWFTPTSNEAQRENVPELFTMYYESGEQSTRKYQEIALRKCKLLCSILDTYKPDIWCSQMFPPRYDDRIYNCFLEAALKDDWKKVLAHKETSRFCEDGADTDCEKEIVFQNYDRGVKTITFSHISRHYKLLQKTEAVCKIIFDTIKPTSAPPGRKKTITDGDDEY